MTSKIGIKEVIDQAIKIEIIGEKIYHHLANTYKSENFRPLFKKLAEDECNHHKFFKNMNEELIEKYFQKKIEMSDIASNSKMLNDKIFNRAETLLKLTQVQSPYELLNQCVEIELEVIQYFTRLRNFMIPKEQDSLTPIINEEKNHVKLLIGERDKYQKKP